MNSKKLAFESNPLGLSFAQLPVLIIVAILIASFLASGFQSDKETPAGISCSNPCLITITPQGFDYGKSVVVPRGTTVQWLNHDAIDHRIAAFGNWTLDTGIIAPGQTSVAIKLTADGTFGYFCTLSLIHGEITVVD